MGYGVCVFTSAAKESLKHATKALFSYDMQPSLSTAQSKKATQLVERRDDRLLTMPSQVRDTKSNERVIRVTLRNGQCREFSQKSNGYERRGGHAGKRLLVYVIRAYIGDGASTAHAVFI